jgi:HEAT repeat protein
MNRFMFLGAVLLGWTAISSAGDDPVTQDEQILRNAEVQTDGPSLLAFFRQRTLADAERDKFAALVRQLGSKVYREREQAAQELTTRGPAVLELLREASKSGNDAELLRRAEQCAQRIQAKEVSADVRASAARLLTLRKPPGAVEALLAFMPFADNPRVADEVRTALRKLGVQDGKADPALIAGLSDKHAVRRATAGEVLLRGDDVAAKAAARKLLDDPQPLVRWRVATAQAFAKEKEAIPLLINLLPEVTLGEAWQTEDILFRLAEDKNPPAVSVSNDEASRRKCRDAWAAWYAKHADQIDLAKLTEAPPLLGNTVVVLLDLGQVLELNAAKEVRWQVEGLVFPLDVQFLPATPLQPEDRILVAEYHASRVTERTLKGEVKWQVRVPGPLVAQRLPNGNTFVATDSQLLEYKGDTEVMNLSIPNGERIMKAMKLPGGEIACLTADARIVRLDAKTGNELSGFGITLAQRLFGGRIHMLPSGRVLVPHNSENKVIEYDARGKEVWSVEVDQPIAATRLPNGNTLVTTMLPNRGAVEFDRSGREVWTYRTNTRVTRALRR